MSKLLCPPRNRSVSRTDVRVMSCYFYGGYVAVRVNGIVFILTNEREGGMGEISKV